MKKALIFAFVSVLIAGVILSGGCGDGGGGPEGVLQKFLDATVKKDFDTMKALVTVQDRQLIEEEEKPSSSASTGDIPVSSCQGKRRVEGQFLRHRRAAIDDSCRPFPLFALIRRLHVLAAGRRGFW